MGLKNQNASKMEKKIGRAEGQMKMKKLPPPLLKKNFKRRPRMIPMNSSVELKNKSISYRREVEPHLWGVVESQCPVRCW